jgi:RNA methyltransferase, TrmH family
MSILITSLQNPLVKNILLLQEKPRERKQQNTIVIEGIREISQAFHSGHSIKTLINCPEILDNASLAKFAAEHCSPCEITEVSRDVFNRLAYRQDHGGLIALAQPRKLFLQDLHLNDNPLILILESVEKPGNLGAILRTADAAAVTAVIICDQQTDLYNPNTIRASLGTIFTNQVILAGTIEAIRWLKNNNIRIFSTALTATMTYSHVNWNIPAAIVLGSEANGLSQPWIDDSDYTIKIPMNGKVDSLNVSASAAIVVYEALRQRGFRV